MIDFLFFFLLIPCFATQSDSVPQSWAYSFESGKKLFKENKNEGKFINGLLNDVLEIKCR